MLQGAGFGLVWRHSLVSTRELRELRVLPWISGRTAPRISAIRHSRGAHEAACSGRQLAARAVLPASQIAHFPRLWCVVLLAAGVATVKASPETSTGLSLRAGAPSMSSGADDASNLATDAVVDAPKKNKHDPVCTLLPRLSARRTARVR